MLCGRFVDVWVNIGLEELVGLLASVFELTLLKLEQCPLVLLKVLGKVVSHVGPLQNLSASDHLFRTLLKELKLFSWILLYLV